ncbi:MAG: flavodoxin family protein [Betaproteobacteria bacterium]|nr:flavodoxin family protein [Betaproteobacteria bacterium]
MSRILVVCYSRCGTTLGVATRIAERCGADLELIKDKTRATASWVGCARPSRPGCAGSRGSSHRGGRWAGDYRW